MTPERLKAVSLLVFTFQNAAFALLMRLSKVRAAAPRQSQRGAPPARAHQVYGTQYNSTMAVLVTEALKLPLGSTRLLASETRVR